MYGFLPLVSLLLNAIAQFKQHLSTFLHLCIKDMQNRQIATQMCKDVTIALTSLWDLLDTNKYHFYLKQFLFAEDWHEFACSKYFLYNNSYNLFSPLQELFCNLGNLTRNWSWMKFVFQWLLWNFVLARRQVLIHHLRTCSSLIVITFVSSPLCHQLCFITFVFLNAYYFHAQSLELPVFHKYPLIFEV